MLEVTYLYMTLHVQCIANDHDYYKKYPNETYGISMLKLI